MIHLKTFEENTNKKTDKKQEDNYTKLKYCYKCEQMAKHLNGKCLNCKKLKQQEKDREKNWGVK